jgi:sulfatase modifying factor 1
MRSPRSLPLAKPGPLAIAAVTAAALGLGACSGDDGGGEGESSASESGTTGEDPTTDTGTDTGGGEGSNLVEIPGATYMMGCGEGDTDCDSDNPGHDVTVSAFYIERTEVSVADYQACVDAGACSPAGTDPDCNYGVAGREDHPINCVSWEHATDYCTFMGRRLPTEAEWELAAAGPDSRTYPWGTAEASCDHAHMFQMVMDGGDYGCLTGETSPVVAYEDAASVNGVLQLAGNVDEWVADWYAADYYESGENSDPSGPADGTQRVNRGGDMYDASPLNLRVFERRKADPLTMQPERGFRCASDTP